MSKACRIDHTLTHYYCSLRVEYVLMNTSQCLFESVEVRIHHILSACALASIVITVVYLARISDRIREMPLHKSVVCNDEEAPLMCLSARMSLP